MSRKFPAHWRMPTEATLERYVFGKAQGLVSADHPALHRPAETVADSDMSGRDVRKLIWRMHVLVRHMREAGHPIAGVSAPEFGESIRVSLLPEGRGHGPKHYREVINGVIEHDPNTPSSPLVAHSTYSSNEAVAKLRSPERHVLQGYDWNGNPIEPLMRSDLDAAVDMRQIALIESGIHPMDVALGMGIQLDYRPPEEEAAYNEFLRRISVNATPEENWHLTYPPDQWAAVKAGEFTLAQFVET